MQSCLNGVQISEVPKFLAENQSETTHAIELDDPLQLNGITSDIDVYSSSVVEYKNDDIPKIQLTA